APQDGTIIQRNAAVGALVGPQAPVVTLASDTLDVVLQLEEGDADTVTTGQQVTLALSAAPGQSFTGTVTSVFPVGDPHQHAFAVHVRPDIPPERLKAGMSVLGSVVLAEHGDVPAVPREALVQSGGKDAVFVVGADGRAALHPVQVGLIGERL